MNDSATARHFLFSGQSSVGNCERVGSHGSYPLEVVKLFPLHHRMHHRHLNHSYKCPNVSWFTEVYLGFLKICCKKLESCLASRISLTLERTCLRWCVSVPPQVSLRDTGVDRQGEAKFWLFGGRLLFLATSKFSDFSSPIFSD